MQAVCFKVAVEHAHLSHTRPHLTCPTERPEAAETPVPGLKPSVRRTMSNWKPEKALSSARPSSGGLLPHSNSFHGLRRSPS